MKKILSNKIFIKFSLYAVIVSIVLNLVILLFEQFNLFLLNGYISFLSLLLTIIFAFLLFLSLSVKKSFRALVNVIATIVFIAVLSLYLYIGLIISLASRNIADFYTSEDGKNTIVVFEDGFIDAYYHAYPVKYKLFYYNNNDTFASRHDFWGGAYKEIVWEKDKAIVYIIFYNQGKNETDKLVIPLN